VQSIQKAAQQALHPWLPSLSLILSQRQQMSKSNPLGVSSEEPTPAATPPHIHGLARPEGSHAGTWGEHHGPNPVSVSRGLHTFDRLARQTSKLHETNREHERVSNVLGFPQHLTTQADVEKEGARLGEEKTFGEVEEHPKESEEAVHDAADEGFDLRKWIENRIAAEDSRGIPRKRVGLSWRNLRVVAPGGRSAVFIKTLPQAVLGTFGIDLAYFAKGLFQGLLKRNTKLNLTGMKQIIGGHEGVLRPGEMLLVLGRPGSGCSTFLQAITSSLASSLTLDPASSISYGGLTPDEITRKLRGEVVYAGEDDLHYPHLTVSDTLKFALKNKVPSGQKRLSGETRNQFITM
jgi:ATP-binding cassette, subfamily G (WHITE), member 2, SNQ2